jgi:hypothetical protein
MNKHVLIATGLAVLSAPAFATKTRMTSLGQDSNYGSHYIKDTRSIFRNAAHVNSMKNYVVTEWGTDAANAAGTAEGGFFREAGNFSYGVYLGSDLESQEANRASAAAGGYAGSTIAQGAAALVDRDNEIDLFFAGDAGLEWGVRLSHASGKNESTGNLKADQSSLGLGFGVVMGELEGYANLALSDKSENLAGATTAGVKWEGATGIVAGLKYGWMGHNFFASYETRGSEFTAGTGIAKNETSQNIITVGVGQVKEVSATSRMNWDVAYKATTNEDKDGTTVANNREQKLSALPLTVGFETDATSWLTWRGSVSQNVVLNNSEVKVGTATTKSTTANTTTVAAGATLNFGKLKVDGAIGTATGAAGAGGLSTDALLTTVGVHYWF